VWSRLDLGVGLIATGGVDLLWPDIADLVDVVEVEPQTLWDDTQGDGKGLDRRALSWLRSLGRPLLSHGVGFPVGGTVAPDPDGVRASARSARELDAVHWSEHLSFNRAGQDGEHAGYLLPPIPTSDSVAAAVGHIRGYQEQLDRPFLVETPTSYLRPAPGDLTDGEYVARIADEADCGILLDLHNIWANELNGRQSVAEFVDAIPLDRVWEVHLAGGFEFNGYHLDAHVGPVAEPLLALARQVVPRLPNVRALLFEAVPESVAALGSAGLRSVLHQLHDLARLPVTSAAPAGPAQRRTGAPAATTTAADREATLLAFTTRHSEVLPDGDPGAEVLRLLTDEARLSLLAVHRPDELARLVEAHGREGTERLLREFLSESTASSWPRDQAAAFDRWLSRQDRSVTT
jgi:uncharacterized protein (UPF0276 family)